MGSVTGQDPWLSGCGPHWGHRGRGALCVENLITIMKPAESLICFLLSPCTGNSKNAGDKILSLKNDFIGL